MVGLLLVGGGGLGVAAWGCRAGRRSPAIPAGVPAAEGPAPWRALGEIVRRFPLATRAGSVELKGLSGLASDASGGYWAVPERQRWLARLDLEQPIPTGVVGALLPIDGVPDGTDTEALAVLGPDRFALGTETLLPMRASDDILVVERRGERAAVTERIPLPYSLWGMRAEVNHGIEGLCAASGVLVAGVETKLARVGGGWDAPLGVYDLTTRTWTAWRLPLAGDEGALSSLDCKAGDPGSASTLRVLAVQRNKRATFLHGFELPLAKAGAIPRAGAAATLRVLWTLDLKSAHPDLPNLEGVAWLGERDFVLVSDNDYGGITGPTEAVVVRGQSPAPAPAPDEAPPTR